MKTKSLSLLIKAVIVFTSLVLLGVGMTVGAQLIPGANEQNVLINMGSAIVGGSLAFFLIEVFRLERER